MQYLVKNVIQFNINHSEVQQLTSVFQYTAGYTSQAVLYLAFLNVNLLLYIAK